MIKYTQRLYSVFKIEDLKDNLLVFLFFVFLRNCNYNCMCCLFCVESEGFDVFIGAEPSMKGGFHKLDIIDLLIYITLAIFFMCFMYLFQPLLPDPHSNMNMTYDHCRLLREKHNDKVSVLN